MRSRRTSGPQASGNGLICYVQDVSLAVRLLPNLNIALVMIPCVRARANRAGIGGCFDCGVTFGTPDECSSSSSSHQGFVADFRMTALDWGCTFTLHLWCIEVYPCAHLLGRAVQTSAAAATQLHWSTVFQRTSSRKGACVSVSPQFSGPTQHRAHPFSM